MDTLVEEKLGRTVRGHAAGQTALGKQGPGALWWSVARTRGSIPGLGTKIPQAAQHGTSKSEGTGLPSLWTEATGPLGARL